jgi:hypothetical protein
MIQDSDQTEEVLVWLDDEKQKDNSIALNDDSKEHTVRVNFKS